MAREMLHSKYRAKQYVARYMLTHAWHGARVPDGGGHCMERAPCHACVSM